MSFTRPEVLFLTGGHASAWMRGEVVWTLMNGALRGEVAVTADGFAEDEVKILFNLSRPNRPTLVLQIRRRHCWRLDVNQAHESLPGTHLQETDATGRELRALDAIGQFPPVPEDGHVRPEIYGALLRAFAAHFNIGEGTLDWVDPPAEGGTR